MFILLYPFFFPLPPPSQYTAIAKDKDLEYYNDLSDDDKLPNVKKLNDYEKLIINIGKLARYCSFVGR